MAVLRNPRIFPARTVSFFFFHLILGIIFKVDNILILQREMRFRDDASLDLTSTPIPRSIKICPRN